MKINLGKAVLLRDRTAADVFPGVVLRNAPVPWTIRRSVSALAFAIHDAIRRK